MFITGNRDSGKSSICKTLVNYSIKLGWTPLLADIDLSQNGLFAPGCLSATLVEDVIDGCTDTFTTKSVNYFHGACSQNDLIITPELFNTQISQLAECCEMKQMHDLD